MQLATAAWDDPLEADEFTRFDHPTAGLAASHLALDGLRCAACAVTIEAALARQPGVQTAEVNVASRRLHLVWRPGAARLSTLVQAVESAGYRVYPARHIAQEHERARERRAALWRLFVAGFAMMQVMMYALPLYVARPGEITPDVQRLLAWASWMLSLPVVLFAAVPFYRGAWQSLRQRHAGMDVPVALGIFVTFAASSYAAFVPNGVLGSDMYFDSLAMFVFFLLGGRMLELRAQQRAAADLEHILLRLPQAVERRAADGSWQAVTPRRLQVGDEVRLLAGQSLPADGVLIDGPVQVDEAVLTGESQPRTRHAGDVVVCGSFALSAALRMRVTAVGDATRFGQITALAQQAAASKPSLVRQADRYARLFVPLVLVLAALSALWWVRTDPARAVWSAVAVLIVTCPCALSLAAPAALLASAGALARRGVLLGNLQALEALAGVQRVVFDKTGTLTADRLRLVSVTPLRAGVQVDAALQRAAWLAAASLHPVSRAVVQAAQPTVNAFGEVAVREQPGQGLEATDAQGIHWRLGSDAFAGAEVAAASGPTAVLSDSQGPVVRLQFEEQLRADAVATVRALRDAGLRVSLLSGDQADAVQRVARACGIDTVLAAATPEAKVDYLKRCHALGERVLMVGDGLNDGPVLAAADVAIAVGEAVPLSKARADLVLPGSLLEPVAFAVTQARRTLRIVRQNLAWAVLYNLACVPLAMLGYLPPWLAGLGMAGSSLWVVSNALRLTRAPRTHAMPPEPAAEMARAAA